MSAHDELDEFKRVYAYQEQVKDDPLIKHFSAAWMPQWRPCQGSRCVS